MKRRAHGKEGKETMMMATEEYNSWGENVEAIPARKKKKEKKHRKI